MYVPLSGSQSSPLPYDPWADINDDGKIDIKDIAYVAARFGAIGTPINKTALLLYLNKTVRELQAKIDSLNASIIELQDKFEILKTPKVIATAINVNVEPSTDTWSTYWNFQFITNETVDVLILFAGQLAAYRGTGDSDIVFRFLLDGTNITPYPGYVREKVKAFYYDYRVDLENGGAISGYRENIQSGLHTLELQIWSWETGCLTIVRGNVYIIQIPIN